MKIRNGPDFGFKDFSRLFSEEEDKPDSKDEGAVDDIVEEGYIQLDSIPDEDEMATRAAGAPMVESDTSFAPFAKIMTARQLEERIYPMPKWVILDVLPQGITLLAGDPKVGKTRLATNIALAVARGEKVLGVLDCRKTGVLCLFLEDPPRRVQERLRDLLPAGEVWPDNLYIATEWQKDTAGLKALYDFLTQHPGVGLVIIDVLERIRPLFAKGSVISTTTKPSQRSRPCPTNTMLAYSSSTMSVRMKEQTSSNESVELKV